MQGAHQVGSKIVETTPLGAREQSNMRGHKREGEPELEQRKGGHSSNHKTRREGSHCKSELACRSKNIPALTFFLHSNKS
eukprot:c34649_g1_i1 orf=35-274(-)